MPQIKNGTVKHSKDVDFTGDYYERSHASDPGYYIWFRTDWKGPFESEDSAKEAWREWEFELKLS